MNTLPKHETTDDLTAAPQELQHRLATVEAWDRVYQKHGIATPVSGDAIARGRADWDRD